MKRLMDLILAVILLLISLPCWVVIGPALLLFSPGPPLFIHPRVGRYGRPFGLIKFRTMVKSGPDGSCITVQGDRRITGIGRILRFLKLDELPQLVNIVKGDMTFVGPRPEVQEFVALYTPLQREILNFRPGLVDPATLKFRHEERLLAGFDDPQQGYREIILPEKIRLSLEYQRRRTVWSDLLILLRTLISIPRGR